MKKVKKPINIVYESLEAISNPDSPEARYISKLIDIAENSSFVRLKAALTDSRGEKVYEFEVDEGYIGTWEHLKYNAKEEVGYNV